MKCALVGCGEQLLYRFDRRSLFLWAAAFLCILLIADTASAGTTGSGGGAGLPWEAPLTKLRQSFSGPVAFSVALIGIIAAGATLIWGGEVSEFARRMVYLVLVICVLVLSNTMLTGGLFTGAVVPAPDALALQPVAPRV